MTNVAHQIGGSLGLAVLVAVFAAADAGGTLHDAALLAHRISASLTAGAVLLALALIVALAVRPRPVPSPSSSGSTCRHRANPSSAALHPRGAGPCRPARAAP